MWQLPSQVNTVGNSYVMLTGNGRVVVIDGGSHQEEFYLRGFLAALGNEVEAWFVSHPHEDHVGALTTILKNPDGLKIKRLYESRFPEELIEADDQLHRKKPAYDYYDALEKSGIQVIQLKEPGLEDEIDGLNFKVLGVTNPEITVNPFNNSSVVIRVWDKKKSIVFLGDTGVESGNKLLNSQYKKDLDCDYLQMAHHGQQGCNEYFYKSIKFRACLWATPTWVWNNDVGEGFNTAYMTTIETRRWMDEIGITEHYIAWQGLVKIE
jgi:beta-lactamase superfamily II metal-dependent hydrolase